MLKKFFVTVLFFVFLLFSSKGFAEVYVSNEQMNIFNQNGISVESVRLNIDLMRSEGKNDSEIQDKILEDIEILKKQEQSQQTSPHFFGKYFNYKCLLLSLLDFLFVGLLFILLIKFKMKIIEIFKKVFNKKNCGCCKTFIRKNWFKIGLLIVLFYIAMKM